MHVGETSEEILHDLMLKDRVRRNEIIERRLQFGTTVRFVRDSDDVLARDGGDEDDSVLQTEVATQAMRNALNTRGLDVRELTEKEISDEKQRIAREQSLKYRKGGLSRVERRKMKRERTATSVELRKQWNSTSKRRLAVVQRYLSGGGSNGTTSGTNAGTGKDESGMAEFQRMLKKKGKKKKKDSKSRSSLVVVEEDDEEEDNEEEERKRKGEEPLRPAVRSALFRPKRMSPSKMTRSSRASLLPLGLSRIGSRKMLRESAILLPSEKLALEEKKSAEQILEEKLKKMLAEDDKADDNTAVAAVVPANLLPPPFEQEVEAKRTLVGGDDDDDDNNNNNNKEEGSGDEGAETEEMYRARQKKEKEESMKSSMAAEKKRKNQKDRMVRSLYVGFSPGFRTLTEPWKQTVFSLELPRIECVRGNGAQQF